MKRLGIISLAACLIGMQGCGGGGGTESPRENPCGISCQPTSAIAFEPQKSTLPANANELDIEFPDSPFATAIVVRAFRSNNTPVPEQTLVTLNTSNISQLQVGIPELYGARFASVCALTSGGIANFMLYSGPTPGQVRVTASYAEPFQPGTRQVNTSDRTVTCTNQFNQAGTRSVAADLIYTIGPGIPSAPRIEIVPRRTTLPINSLGVAPFIGSPFMTEAEIFRRRSNGQIILSDTVTLNVTPTDIGAFSLPNSAANPNALQQLLIGGPVPVSGGRGIFFAHSGTRAGSFFLTASAIDPDSGRPVQITREIRVTAATSPNPGAVSILFDDALVYVQGSGGRTTKSVQALVTDGSDSPIADSAANVNNILIEIANPGANGGETLNAVGASGPVEGISIRAKTVAGVLGATFRSGTRQGIVTIRAIADRADNNVDNGIQQPVSDTEQFIVSDGRLFSLRLVKPTTAVTNTILSVPDSNPIDPDVTFERGTYRMTLTALATDRQGNPVIPGTQIEFGMIDSPIVGYPAQGPGFFTIAGGDGDPQEGGTLFTAPTGAFIQPGGQGAGPGDTLIVFGQDVPGNRDLESARTVQRINSATSLNTTVRFNFNDDTGVSVNNGPVLPYVIGRATVANLEQGLPSRVTTNAIGLATTFMNYPVSQLGRRAVIWARGSGDLVQGSPELVTDAAPIVFAGVGSTVTLVVSPRTIRANRDADVQICVYDEARAPIPGVVPGFRFVRLDGSGSVDGTPNSGVVQRPTGADGCTTARVSTRGLLADTSVIFFVGGEGTLSEAEVQITVAGTNVLQAIPSELFGTGGVVRLRLLGQEGTPISGIQINGSCTLQPGATTTGNGQAVNYRINITVPPGVTDDNGETTATIVSELDNFGQPGVGTCVFTGGNASVTVIVRGTNLCAANPGAPQCQGP